jgi:hypothetical protein
MAKTKQTRGDVRFTPVPCDEVAVVEARVGPGGVVPLERPVLIIGPAPQVRRLLALVRKAQRR